MEVPGLAFNGPHHADRLATATTLGATLTVDSRDDEEIKQYQKNVNYVFASAPSPEDDLTKPAADWTTCAFVDGKLATTLTTAWLSYMLVERPLLRRTSGSRSHALASRRGAVTMADP